MLSLPSPGPAYLITGSLCLLATLTLMCPNYDQTFTEKTLNISLVPTRIFSGSRPGVDLHDRIHTSIFQAPASAELKFSVGFEGAGW